jgi:hypothetical protein
VATEARQAATIRLCWNRCLAGHRPSKVSSRIDVEENVVLSRLLITARNPGAALDAFPGVGRRRLVTERGLHGWLLFVHLLVPMLWLGGPAALSASAAWAVRRSDPGAVARFVMSLRAVGPVLLAPGPVILLGSGVWMVVQDDDSNVSQGWIVAGLGLFAAAFLVGAAYNSRAAIAAQRAAARGDDAEAARQLRHWTCGALIICVLLAVTTWDIVFRPGG